MGSTPLMLLMLLNIYFLLILLCELFLPLFLLLHVFRQSLKNLNSLLRLRPLSRLLLSLNRLLSLIVLFFYDLFRGSQRRIDYDPLQIFRNLSNPFRHFLLHRTDLLLFRPHLLIREGRTLNLLLPKTLMHRLRLILLLYLLLLGLQLDLHHGLVLVLQG